MHQSLHSQDDSIQSTIDEVESSAVTVESYWEAFKNGEQDLLTLLTAQRQLNTAQVSLIESYQNRLNDYYKLLFESGALVAHFQLDPTKDNFIDFTRSDYTNLLKTPAQDALVNDLEKNKEKEITASIDNNVTENIDSNTGEKIYKTRILLGISRSELSRVIGVSLQQITL